MKYIFIPFICFYIVAVTSCGKSGVKPQIPTDSTSTKTGTGTAPTSGTPDVYVVGFEDDIAGPGTPQACYWKNGVKVILPTPNGGEALAILISGSDVYIAGFYGFSPQQPALWKNGQFTPLSGIQSSRASCLAYANNNLYMGIWQEALSRLAATYASYLTISSTQTLQQALGDAQNHPIVNAMAASNGTLYSVGSGLTVFNSTLNAYIPVYWTNTAENSFSFPSDLSTYRYRYGEAYGVALSGNDVYAVGEVDYTNSTDGSTGGSAPVLWKNNVATILDKTAQGIWTPGAGTALTISNNDIYVAGILGEDNGDVPVVWKNGAMTQLQKHAADAEPTGIVVSGSDFYVSGNDGVSTITACYWKNGSEITLTDGTKNAGAYGIYVIQH